MHGQIGPDHITADGLTDARVAKAHSEIIIREDSRHSKSFPLSRWSDVTVHTHDGNVVQSGDVHARGGPEAPMTMAEIEAKFNVMAALLAHCRRANLWAMRSR